MNLTKLFEMQRVLDERIIKEKGLEGQDLLPQKILALQVELGECANEWRGFKFWSNRQEANTEVEIICSMCDGSGDENWEASLQLLSEGQNGLDFEPCIDCNATGKLGKKNPLLEEYIDCLHFILSIGITLGYLLDEMPEELFSHETILGMFGEMFWRISELDAQRVHNSYVPLHTYKTLVACFYGLGKHLGFTWEQIEAAYMEKNVVNHDRQNTGY